MARPKGLAKTGGRQRGSVNKSTALAKEAIALAAQKLGGVNRLAAWAKEDPKNEQIFWGTIYPKLVPVQVAGDKDNPLNVIQRIQLIGIEPDANG